MSSTYEKKQAEWTRRYHGSLVGMKCVEVRSEEDDYSNEAWPILVFENADGSPIEIDGEAYDRMEVMVSRDPEGNGPGHILGLPNVPDNENPFRKGE